MCPVRRDPPKVLVVLAIFQVESLVQAGVVLFLEDLGVFALFDLIFLIDAVFRDLIDEEKREDLDSLCEELLLFLKMSRDGLTNLEATHDVTVTREKKLCCTS
jgi:hypothetical protein